MRHLVKNARRLVILVFAVIGLGNLVILPGHSSSLGLTSSGSPLFRADNRVEAAAQSCTPPPSGMVAWFPGDGNANDIQGSNNGTLQNGATFAPGIVDQAFSFDGAGASVSVTDAPSLHLSTQFTLESWVHPANLNNFPII